MISAAAVWAIWGGDVFPAEPDPTGSKINVVNKIMDAKLI